MLAHLKDILLSFPDKSVLDDVSLTVYAQDRLALMYVRVHVDRRHRKPAKRPPARALYGRGRWRQRRNPAASSTHRDCG
jgi:hypothetical protein